MLILFGTIFGCTFACFILVLFVVVMTRETTCTSCNKMFKIRQGQLVEVNYVSSLDKQEV